VLSTELNQNQGNGIADLFRGDAAETAIYPFSLV
jgi:hypothetical protein